MKRFYNKITFVPRYMPVYWKLSAHFLLLFTNVYGYKYFIINNKKILNTLIIAILLYNIIVINLKKLLGYS